ncbi:hypothetical protein [Nocardia pseudovaccinii]|nr:hypothetical protein [Nocardia pseudovaccinii]
MTNKLAVLIVRSLRSLTGDPSEGDSLDVSVNNRVNGVVPDVMWDNRTT